MFFPIASLCNVAVLSLSRQYTLHTPVYNTSTKLNVHTKNTVEFRTSYFFGRRLKMKLLTCFCFIVQNYLISLLQLKNNKFIFFERRLPLFFDMRVIFHMCIRPYILLQHLWFSKKKKKGNTMDCAIFVCHSTIYANYDDVRTDKQTKDC